MKLTLLGSGVRSPGVVRGLARRQDDLGLTEVVLHDADQERLEIVAALIRHKAAEWGAAFEVRAERDRRAALAGARCVYAAIRVGQERARALDESVALQHGLLGQETTGAGGFAMAMRTIPVMLDYARIIEEVAPDALVVNFTNPVGLVLQALTTRTSIQVVGVCDGPPSMKASLAQLFGVPQEDVHAEYGGLNHCGWIRRALVDGRDVVPEAIARYEDLRRLGEGWRLFDAELVRALGLLPMEYLYFYYYREQAREHIVRSGGTRGGQIEDLYREMWPRLHAEVTAGDLDAAWETLVRAQRRRGETYLARERGDAVEERAEAGLAEPEGRTTDEGGYEAAAASAITAVAANRPAELILNVPNAGALPDLAGDDVVEVTCTVDGDGARPIPQTALPLAARALVEPVKAYERLTVEAADTGSYDAALEALVVHPLVGSYPAAKAVLEGYLAVHPELGYVRPRASDRLAGRGRRMRPTRRALRRR
jgi:6-phospho-beta-glucosidase